MSEEGNFSGFEPRLGGGVYDWHYLFEDMISGRERQDGGISAERTRQLQQENERRDSLGVVEILERLAESMNDRRNLRAEAIRGAFHARELDTSGGLYVVEEDRLVSLRSMNSVGGDNLILGVGVSEDSDVRFFMRIRPLTHDSGYFFNNGFGTCHSREDVIWAIRTFVTSTDTTTPMRRNRFSETWDERFFERALMRRWPVGLNPMAQGEQFTLLGKEIQISRGDSRWWRVNQPANRSWMVPVVSEDFNGVLLRGLQEQLSVSGDVRDVSCYYYPVDGYALVRALGEIGKHFVVTQVEPIYSGESNDIHSYLILVGPKK